MKQLSSIILTWACTLVTLLVGAWFLWHASMVHHSGEYVSAPRDITKIDLEDMYANGNRALWLVSALADQRAAGGSRDNAIAVLRDYVAAQPNDVEGRKKLAAEYSLAARYDEFQQQYEAISALEPDETNLAVLSDLYSWQGNYPKQAEILRKMIEATKGRKPKNFSNLAITQLLAGNASAAQTTLKELRTHYPDYVDYKTVRVEVSIAIEQGEIDVAYAQATAWIARQNDRIAKGQDVSEDSSTPVTLADARTQLTKELAELSSLFLSAYNANMAGDIIAPHEAWLANAPELALAYVKALIEQGKQEEAYQKILALDHMKALDPMLYVPYVKLAATYGSEAQQQAIANNLDASLFEERQAISLLNEARNSRKSALLSAIATRFDDPSILVTSPVLHVFVDWARASADLNLRIQKALASTLLPHQRISLAQICAAIADEVCFQALVKQLGSIEQMKSKQIQELAEIYIASNRSNTLVDVFTAAMRTPLMNQTLVTEQSRLAAAAGRDDIIGPWLKANVTSAPLGALHELFYLANDRSHHDIAAKIAEALYQRLATNQHRAMVLAAYIEGTQLPMLIRFLRIDMDNHPGLYPGLLRTLASHDAVARKDLVVYCVQALKTNEVPHEQQLIYAEILIAQGAVSEALPYIQVNATRYGGAWQLLATKLTSSTN
jgi:hypothetical protein